MTRKTGLMSQQLLGLMLWFKLDNNNNILTKVGFFIIVTRDSKCSFKREAKEPMGGHDGDRNLFWKSWLSLVWLIIRSWDGSRTRTLDGSCRRK